MRQHVYIYMHGFVHNNISCAPENFQLSCVKYIQCTNELCMHHVPFWLVLPTNMQQIKVIYVGLIVLIRLGMIVLLLPLIWIWIIYNFGLSGFFWR